MKIGIVENNGFGDNSKSDPMGINRVQLRIIGLHTDDKSLLPTEALPWAEYCGSTIYGFGKTSSGLSVIPELESHLYIDFINDDPNRPIIMGSVIGKDHKSEDDKQLLLVTPSGHKIEINDTDGKSKIKITTSKDNSFEMDDSDNNQKTEIKTGKHTFLLDDSNNKIEMKSDKHELIMDDTGNKIELKTGSRKLLLDDTNNKTEITDGTNKISFELTQLKMTNGTYTIKMSPTGVDIS